MTNAELREFCTQMIGKFKLLSDIQKEMQYETIDAKFTEWELKKLIFALNVLREEVRKYVDTADTPQTDCEDVWRAGYKTGYDKGYKDAQKVKDSQDLVKDLVKAFGEDGTWLERQGVYTLTLAEAKQRAVDIIESVLAKDEPQTEERQELEAYRKCIKSRSFWDAKHCDDCHFYDDCPFDPREDEDEPQTDCAWK